MAQPVKAPHYTQRAFAADGETCCQPGNQEFENNGVNHTVRIIIRPHPKANSRRHERGLNKRTRRIRTRNPGLRAEPWGFRAHPMPTILKPENGTKAK